MLEESIKTPSTPDNSFHPKVTVSYPILKAKFYGNCLKQDDMSFLHKNVVYIYIYIYYLQIRCTVKRFKPRFHVR